MNPIKDFSEPPQSWQIFLKQLERFALQPINSTFENDSIDKASFIDQKVKKEMISQLAVDHIEKTPSAGPFNLQQIDIQPHSNSGYYLICQMFSKALLSLKNKKNRSNFLEKIPEQLLSQKIYSYLAPSDKLILGSVNKIFNKIMIIEFFQDLMAQCDQLLDRIEKISFSNKEEEKSLEIDNLNKTKLKILNFKFILKDKHNKTQNYFSKEYFSDYYFENEAIFNEIKNDLAIYYKRINTKDFFSIISSLTQINGTNLLKYNNDLIHSSCNPFQYDVAKRIYLLASFRNAVDQGPLIPSTHPFHFLSDLEFANFCAQEGEVNLAGQFLKQMTGESSLFFLNNEWLENMIPLLMDVLEEIAKVKHKESIQIAKNLIEQFPLFSSEFQTCFNISTSLNPSLYTQTTPSSITVDNIVGFMKKIIENIKSKEIKSYFLMKAAKGLIQLENSNQAIQLIKNHLIKRDWINICIALADCGEIDACKKAFHLYNNSSKKQSFLNKKNYDPINSKLKIDDDFLFSIFVEKYCLGLIKKGEIEEAISFYKKFYPSNLKDIPKFLLKISKFDCKKTLIFLEAIENNNTGNKSEIINDLCLKLIDQYQFEMIPFLLEKLIILEDNLSTFFVIEKICQILITEFGIPKANELILQLISENETITKEKYPDFFNLIDNVFLYPIKKIDTLIATIENNSEDFKTMTPRFHFDDDEDGFRLTELYKKLFIENLKKLPDVQHFKLAIEKLKPTIHKITSPKKKYEFVALILYCLIERKDLQKLNGLLIAIELINTLPAECIEKHWNDLTLNQVLAFALNNQDGNGESLIEKIQNPNIKKIIKNERSL